MNPSRLLAGYEQHARQMLALHAMAFPAQRAFLDDPARLSAALCTRRAGKSTAIGCDIIETHLAFPGSVSPYIGLTREMCKRIMWPILEEIDERFKLGLEFKLQQLAVVSPNGSTTYLIGCDASANEMAKVVGQKYPKAWIDEAQDFRIDLYDLVTRRLRPATIDYSGKIRMTGTPGDFIGPRERRHLFFAVTKPQTLYPDDPIHAEARGWTVHRWRAADNPHISNKLAEEERDIDRTAPELRATAKYRREYGGEWVIDDTKLVYHAPDAAWVDEPAPALKTHVIGIDLGWEDASAFTVAGWKPHDPTLHVLRSYKRSRLTLSEVADEIRALQQTHSENAWLVVDGAAKQSVEEMRQRFKLPLEAAQKQDKPTFIRMMNSDLASGRIRLSRDGCRQLRDEWDTLIWDDRASVPRERDGCENHCADSALYAWRLARNYVYSDPPEPEPGRDTEAWMDKRAAEKAKRLRGAKPMGGLLR